MPLPLGNPPNKNSFCLALRVAHSHGASLSCEQLTCSELGRLKISFQCSKMIWRQTLANVATFSSRMRSLQLQDFSGVWKHKSFSLFLARGKRGAIGVGMKRNNISSLWFHDGTAIFQVRSTSSIWSGPTPKRRVHRREQVNIWLHYGERRRGEGESWFVRG